jgi:hypothetical protein
LTTLRCPFLNADFADIIECPYLGENFGGDLCQDIEINVQNGDAWCVLMIEAAREDGEGGN